MRNYKYLLTALMLSCVDSGDTEFQDTLSGIYYLHGPRTTVEDPCFHCPAGQDTLREFISFSVIARLAKDNPERIQFYGVQGADTGDIAKRLFPDCTRSADCEIFGNISLSAGGTYEIDIENIGHRYQATGSLIPTTIDLKGQYSYENITIDYDFSGNRISLRLED